MLLKRMAVMLMGRVRNQMSAELLGVGPGAGQIEPSATGAPPPHTNQYGTSLSIYSYSAICFSNICKQN